MKKTVSLSGLIPNSKEGLIRETLVSFIIIAMIILLVICIFLIKDNITGEVIVNSYTHTKAICNRTNYCQDYEIVCENQKVINMIPITDAVIQHSEDWQDPRTQEEITRLCG